MLFTLKEVDPNNKICYLLAANGPSIHEILWFSISNVRWTRDNEFHICSLYTDSGYVYGYCRSKESLWDNIYG